MRIVFVASKIFFYLPKKQQGADNLFLQISSLSLLCKVSMVYKIIWLLVVPAAISGHPPRQRGLPATCSQPRKIDA